MKDKLSLVADDATATHKKGKLRRRIRRGVRRVVKENQEAVVLPVIEEGMVEQQPIPFVWTAVASKKMTLKYLQHLFINANFNACTYLLALQLLIPLTISGSQQRCMKLAAAIFFISGKMNETVKATMNFILQWSEKILKREDVISAEEEILNHINFCMPSIHEDSYENVVAVCCQLEDQIFAMKDV